MKNSVEFYDIYDYYYQPIWERGFFQITIVLLTIIILAVLGYYIGRYFLRKRAEKKAQPWQVALSQLDALSLKDCETKSDFKRFYFQLTLIIKKYLGNRYAWDTQDKTDEELILFLEEKKFDPVLIADLNKLTQAALWIKFANEDVLRIQAEKDLKVAYNIIEKTRGDDEISKA